MTQDYWEKSVVFLIHYLTMKSAMVCGAGGFIGHHLVKRLKDDGYWVRGVDQTIRPDPQWDTFDEIYQLAADMGGAGYISSGENDASIMQNSASINLNVLNRLHALNEAVGRNTTAIFYGSSACIYSERNQMDPENPNCREDSAYPAEPDREQEPGQNPNPGPAWCKGKK